VPDLPRVFGERAPVAHQRAQDELRLLLAQLPWLSDDDTIAGNQLPGLAQLPAYDQVILRRANLRPAVTA